MRVDDSGSEMDHGGEAFGRFACTHGDAFELCEFAEDIFDKVAPFGHFSCNCAMSPELLPGTANNRHASHQSGLGSIGITARSSTSNISVAFGGMEWPAPRSP